MTLASTITCAAALALSLSMVGGVALAAPGDIDPSFSGDGRVTTDFGGSDLARDVAIQPGGKVIAVGEGPRRGVIAMARYFPSGLLDPTFGVGGKVRSPFGPAQATGAEGVALQADGKIVVAGRCCGGDMAVARFTANGAPDPSFAGDGVKEVSFGSEDWYQGEGRAVAIAPGGKIVVVGSSLYESGSNFGAARLNPNGQLDRTFAGDGTAEENAFPNALRPFSRAEDVAIQPDGRIVLAGTAAETGSDDRIALVRFLSDGKPDRSFSDDGLVRTGFGRGGEAQAYGVDLQRDGRIVVAGSVAPEEPYYRPAVVRYLRNGNLDRTFAGDGLQATKFGGRGGSFQDVAVADGRIVAAGSAVAGPGRMAIARYRISGRLDRGFSGDGRKTIGFGSTGPDRAYGVALYGNGRVVAAGADRKPGGSDFAVARLKG